MDYAPNYLVGCVIQKRTYLLKVDDSSKWLKDTLHPPNTFLGDFPLEPHVDLPHCLNLEVRLLAPNKKLGLLFDPGHISPTFLLPHKLLGRILITVKFCKVHPYILIRHRFWAFHLYPDLKKIFFFQRIRNYFLYTTTTMTKIIFINCCYY